MISISDFKKIHPHLWELPQSLRSNMRTPARVYISEALLCAILADDSLEQLMNAATLPGIERYALAMPDIHQGYGFPVGGVAACRTSDGVISPGGIGYDINCGVRLLLSRYEERDIRPHLEKLSTQIQRDVPSGVGRGGLFPLDKAELTKVLNTGVDWAVKQGYATDFDIAATEENGRYKAANADYVSDDACNRGLGQLGTIGSGNHFIEIQRVDEIFDAETGNAFGLFPGQITVLVHTGSRGLGHQVCTDYVRRMNSVLAKYNIDLPDRELACAPFTSVEGREYFAAMAAAANFAWVNRQLITHQIRNAFQEFFREDSDLRLLYDVCHNIAKVETHGGVECVVHRKGSTRAFGPGMPELAPQFQKTGQPVLIPGSMGTSSYVLAGTELAMRESFGSCCHGAGRALSRMKAKKTLDYAKLLDSLESQGIVVRGGSAKGLVEEAPAAYKDVDAVVDVVKMSGIAKIVARLKPIAVIKG